MKKAFLIFLVLGSWALAAQVSRVEKVLHEIAASRESEQTWELSEAELNQYVEEQLRQSGHEGVNSAKVELDDGSFLLTLDVEGDKLDLGEGNSASAVIQSLLKGNQTLQLEGSVDASGGQVNYDTMGAWINSIPVPVAVVDSLLSQFGKSIEPPFDPAKPYPLPAGLQEIILLPDKAILRN